MYTGFADGINTLFYDANSVIGLVFGDEDAAAGKLIDAIQEQARMHMVSEVYFFHRLSPMWLKFPLFNSFRR